MAPVLFEALDPSETVLYGKLSSDIPNNKYSDRPDLTKFLCRYNFINKKKNMQIFDVRSATFLCDFFIEVKFESYHTESN